jgi:two-component system, response regulator
MSAAVDILLVDDNPDDRELAQIALSRVKRDVTVAFARDGVEALDYLLRRGASADGMAAERPRLVLLDLKLPKLDGIEVLVGLRADPATRTLPVVMLTSSRMEDDIRRCYEAGANGYVVKPARFERFVQAMDEIIAFWLFLNEPPDRS